jgi:hypothetical protein
MESVIFGAALEQMMNSNIPYHDKDVANLIMRGLYHHIPIVSTIIVVNQLTFVIL